MQSLSQDIEDLDQINRLLETLSNSFINKKIAINSKIENPSKNKILLNDMSFTSVDGKVLYGKIEYIESNYKIFIIENSTNQKLKETLEKKYKNVNCYLTGKNLGYGAGNNLGIKNIKTDELCK